ncbi:hypothetical protein ACSS6W_006733 [Trichoderma asperelloides]|uniref:Uncharacterized protein n=1 Tax=Trichoderma asperellum (strain ATCC 204424 / CBS 433.97 / NBRC 101777) TaxID=1042311 RepID=A0A2T3YW95_TRIA4|nr:hypothetical protein M441DRAFT_149766 [Trichoderma asperellum CBS 433.97]KAH8127571.1 hypothetical protein LI328DRAFT_130181 [Trichoderma asperelloides]PTB36816.1 hypothetical protein M441DRAFT_149766 [Trichoderma asperellum CBS 433.97]
MSPTYTMSAHLCRQFYTSWNQSRRQTATTEAAKPAAPSAPSPILFASSRSPTPEKIPERRGSTSSNSSSSSSLSSSPSRH